MQNVWMIKIQNQVYDIYSKVSDSGRRPFITDGEVWIGTHLSNSSNQMIVRLRLMTCSTATGIDADRSWRKGVPVGLVEAKGLWTMVKVWPTGKRRMGREMCELGILLPASSLVSSEIGFRFFHPVRIHPRPHTITHATTSIEKMIARVIPKTSAELRWDPCSLLIHAAPLRARKRGSRLGAGKQVESCVTNEIPKETLKRLCVRGLQTLWWLDMNKEITLNMSRVGWNNEADYNGEGWEWDLRQGAWGWNTGLIQRLDDEERRKSEGYDR